MASRRTIVLICAGIFALNVAVNWPLFLSGESRYRDSIEGGYASMAHFIHEHPDPYGWNPLQYFGLPTHIWYLPVVPYVTALLINVTPVRTPEHVHRLVVTSAACMVPVSMFLFCLYFRGRKTWAAVAALLYTFFSPAYMLFPRIQGDMGLSYLPWHLHVLTKYGEGPHNVGLALIPLALVACWHASTRRGYPAAFAAAVLLAVIALTNWIATLALAWCCLMMLLVGVLTAKEHGFLARRMIGVALLAYLLACFWLTPRFISTTLFNWPSDAFGYKIDATKWMLVSGLGAAVATGLFLVRRYSRYYIEGWISLCLAGFLFIVAGHYWYLLDTIPESRRYAFEAEFFWIVALTEVARRAAAWAHPAGPWAAAAVLAAGAGWGETPNMYVMLNQGRLRPIPRERTIEYKVSRFLESRKPEGRIFAGGGTRFRLNSWTLLHQVGGAFESGLRNRSALYFQYSIRTGEAGVPGRELQEALWQLRACGVEYVVIHGPNSQEHWKDYLHPMLFEGVLEKVFEEGDNRIYKLPFHGYAHLVKPSEYPQGFAANINSEILDPFVRAMDDPGRRLKFEWLGPSRIRITGAIPPDMLVSTRIAFDGGWHASVGGRELKVESDAMGFILLRPPAGQGGIEMRYLPTREHIAMSGVSAVAWIGAAAWLFRSRRRERA